MKIFIKELQSQESGYSGDTPRQRGPYILIPKKSWEFFPYVSEFVFNDSSLITLHTPNGNSILRHYVWHNAKYHLENRRDLSRAHDERRFYRSTLLAQDLKLDRGVFIFFAELRNHEFLVCSVTQDDIEYHVVKQMMGNGNSIIHKNRDEIDRILLSRFSVDSEQELMQASFDSVVIEEDLITALTHETNPDSTLNQSTGDFLSQQQFRKLVLEAYDYKCAVRKMSVHFEKEGHTTYTVLQAAHIMPRSENGPNLPGNGLALSYDLHNMFDSGMWTIINNRVQIHPEVAGQGILSGIDGTLIEPILNQGFFKPEPSYVRFHNDNIYGKFLH